MIGEMVLPLQADEGRSAKLVPLLAVLLMGIKPSSESCPHTLRTFLLGDR